MTRRTNARVAGLAFLVYIAVAMSSIVLFNRATAGEEITARLAGAAQHPLPLRLSILLALLSAVCAIVLGVTLHAITRDRDRDLAMLGLLFRAGEGLLVALSTRATLEVLWLGGSVAAKAPDAVTSQVFGTYLLAGPDWSMAAIFFALGSTFFSWLLLRGRMIPAALAWLGVLASVLLVLCLPLQLAGLLGGPITTFLWLPMLVFELGLALWLIIKGAAAAAPTQPA